MVILRAFTFIGANPTSLLALEKALNGCSREFVDFYRQTNGFAMQLQPDYQADDLLKQLDCFRFDDAAFIIEMLSLNAEYFPGVIVIGGDAATNRVALDLRAAPEVPLVVFRGDEEPYLHTCRTIARSFAEFLQMEEIQKALQNAQRIGETTSGTP